jgi:hypothetical protein
MKSLNTFITLSFLVICISCSSIRVQHEYNVEADFTTLKTFDWLSSPTRRAVDEQTLKLIERAINMQLEAKSIRMTSENPDFLIDLYVGKQAKTYDMGGSHSSRLSSVRKGTAGHISSEEGEIIIDFIDVKTRRMIWRGSATGVVRADLPLKKRKKRINRAIAMIFENFPPATAR